MLTVSRVSKSYPAPGGRVDVLTDVSLTLSPGDAAVIMGPSGSGKSTLLYILGALEAPTAGSIQLDGSNPYDLDAGALAAFRNKEVGFVFQDHCLLPQCTVLENVLVPTLVGALDTEASGYARALIDQMGLTSRLNHVPGQLSGGEKQRVAVARALVRRPRLVLCDEPTGNLDRASGEAVASLLLNLPQRQRAILIVVTHSRELASRFPLRFELTDRRLQQIS